MAATTQQKRDQACHRYYQPWLAALGSSDMVAEHVERLARTDNEEFHWQSIQARDPILISIAQNAVLRLNVRRCLISLIDSKHQYVIAEATRSCSNAFPRGREDDEVWLGTAVLPRPDAICGSSLDSQCETFEDDGAVYKCPGLIIHDCRQDSIFATRPYVMQEEGNTVRLYAGVPLITPDGTHIGVLAITDERARAALSADEMRCMQDLAACSVTHLEWAIDRVDRYKSERMVCGMASFIDDTTSLLDKQKRKQEPPQTDALTQEHASISDDIQEQGVPQTEAIDFAIEPTDTSQTPDSDSTEINGDERKTILELTILPSPSAQTQSGAADPHVKHDADDQMLAMYAIAAKVLRDCTLADGCDIYGASIVGENEASRGEEDEVRSISTDDSPHCKLLSSASKSGAGHMTCPATVSINTLHEYANLFPLGHIFDLLSHRQDAPTTPSPSSAVQTNHADALGTPLAEADTNGSTLQYQVILECFPSAETVIFLPLVDQLENKLAAGIFLWTSNTGRMLIEANLSHLRAFTHCIEREILRITSQRNEAAKNTFVHSISHELRSPLHGILGASEFLADACKASSYEHGLVASIRLCGKQLLDTLNHVLDYSKINNHGGVRNVLQSEADESDLEAVDLSALVEEASEAITVGHTFSNVAQAQVDSSTAKSSMHDSLTAKADSGSCSSGVTVLLDIRPRQSWIVKTSPGGLQRVIMNLLGNALKFTTSGFVALSLRATGEPDQSGKLDILIRIVDSGRGIGKAFQQDRIFTAFTQEDAFSPGTGLGLNVVKQIVSSLGGSIHLRSTVDVGTEVDVRFRLSVAEESSEEDMHNPLLTKSFLHGHSLAQVVEKTRGKHLVFLDPLDVGRTRLPTDPASRFQQNLRETCEQWFDMHVSRATSMSEAPDDVAIYLYGEPPPLEMLRLHTSDDSNQSVPVILACQNDRDALTVVRDQQAFLRRFGKIVEVMQQPCGPRKLAAMLMQCFMRAENADEPQAERAPRPSIQTLHDLYNVPKMSIGMLTKSVSATVALPTPMPAIDLETPDFDQLGLEDKSLDLLVSTPLSHRGINSEQRQTEPSAETLHGLIVDDNKINRQLLIAFMKKAKYSFEEAENGQEAVDAFVRSEESSESKRFNIIFMDISMPVMDGIEATRLIRLKEQEASLARVKIVALTGLGSAKAREDAETAGVDVFLTKPAKFADLQKLLQ